MYGKRGKLKVIQSFITNVIKVLLHGRLDQPKQIYQKQINFAITIFTAINFVTTASTDISTAKALCVFSTKAQTNSKTASIPEITESTMTKTT